MVKNILFAFIENADRINCKTLIPWALDFIESNDAQFETSSSSKIQTIQLFYKYDIVTNSIGFVLYHNFIVREDYTYFRFSGAKIDDLQNNSEFGGALCHSMLKKALKLD